MSVLLPVTTVLFLVFFFSLVITSSYADAKRFINSNDNNSDDTDTGDVQELYITQKLDHFDPTNSATFQQRYFVSYRYHNNHSGTVVSLLCVGGEGPAMDKTVLTNSVHCSGDMIELAKRISNNNKKNKEGGQNVNLYALEHRYYGSSYPKFEDQHGNETSPLTIQNLRYLSSRQALEDMEHFVQTVNRETNVGGVVTNKWVTFGGSYPGLMALYSRYKYPHLIFAAVSSSAPLQLMVDFPGYKARQGWDLKYEKVGGSAECHRIVKEGHIQAVTMMQKTNQNVIRKDTNSNNKDGRVELAKKFNICNPDIALFKRRNQELLLGDGLIDIPSQSNDPSCTENEICNIAGICKYITENVKLLKENKNNVNNTDDTNEYNPFSLPNIELEILAKLAEKQNKYEKTNGKKFQFQFQFNHRIRLRAIQKLQTLIQNNDDDCIDVDYDKYVAFYSSEEVKPFGFRSWLYQTCTEFGFYQTCDDDCPFATNFHQVDLDLEICYRVFNITNNNVYDNVQNSIDYYGGKTFVNTDASNILSINGNVDPWSLLGMEEIDSINYRLPAKVVDGASHHFWTHAVKDTDPLEIIQIRELIYSYLMGWLGIDFEYTII